MLDNCPGLWYSSIRKRERPSKRKEEKKMASKTYTEWKEAKEAMNNPASTSTITDSMPF